MHKEAKNDPKVGKEVLAWTTEFVDLDPEMSLLTTHSIQISRTRHENSTEGLKEENNFYQGFYDALGVEWKQVQIEKEAHMKWYGKEEDWDEMWNLVHYRRDEEGM